MATIEVLARTKSGEPIEGATIHVNPNVMRVQNGGIFGVADASNEAPFREIEFLPRPTYSVTTDEDGRAFLSNLPIVTRNLNLEHHEYAVPIDPLYQDRYIRFELAPGKTKELNLTLERKGVSHIGSLK